MEDAVNAADLIEKAKTAVGGTQRELAEKLNVSPGAISNWLRSGRIPDESRQKVLDLLKQYAAQDVRMPRLEMTEETVPPELATRRQGDIEQARMWARAVWCMNYVHAAPISDDGPEFTTVDVWRAWEHLHVRKLAGKTHISFRHWFSAEFDESGDTKEDIRNWGFLAREETDEVDPPGQEEGTRSVAPPPNMDLRRHKNVLYVAAHKRLVAGATYTDGGYYVRTPGGIRCRRSAEQPMEFAAFSPGCPVETAHLLVSIPRRSYAHPSACTIASPYQLLFELTKMAGQAGAVSRIEEFIEPWGRRLLPEIWDRPGTTFFDGFQPHLPDDFFGGGPDKRDCLHVEVPIPNPLARVVILWGIP